MLESEQEWGKDGNRVVFVIDVRHRSVLCVDVVREVLVADLSTRQRRKQKSTKLQDACKAEFAVRTRGVPYPTKRTFVPFGRWSGRKAKSSRAIAAPVTWHHCRFSSMSPRIDCAYRESGL